MKKISFSFLLPLLSTLLASFIIFSYINHTPRPILTESSKCLCDSKPDPLAKPMMFTYGKFAGQCVNNCRRRSVQILEKNLQQTNDTLSFKIGNVFHQDRFWTTELSLSQIKGAEILFENFVLNLNHVSIRFLFEEPVLLVTQDPTLPKKTMILKDSSLVFSAEAAPPENSKYTLYDSFMGRYGLIYRVYSHEKYRGITNEADHRVRAFSLNLDISEVQSLLISSLTTAQTQPFETYQLLFNNCATKSLDILLDSKNHKLNFTTKSFWTFADPLRGIPSNAYVGTIRSLKWWNLIPSSSDSVNLSN